MSALLINFFVLSFKRQHVLNSSQKHSKCYGNSKVCATTGKDSQHVLSNLFIRQFDAKLYFAMLTDKIFVVVKILILRLGLENCFKHIIVKINKKLYCQIPDFVMMQNILVSMGWIIILSRSVAKHLSSFNFECKYFLTFCCKSSFASVVREELLFSFWFFFRTEKMFITCKFQPLSCENSCKNIQRQLRLKLRGFVNKRNNKEAINSLIKIGI